MLWDLFHYEITPNLYENFWELIHFFLGFISFGSYSTAPYFAVTGSAYRRLAVANCFTALTIISINVDSCLLSITSSLGPGSCSNKSFIHSQSLTMALLSIKESTKYSAMRRIHQFVNKFSLFLRKMIICIKNGATIRINVLDISIILCCYISKIYWEINYICILKF